MSILRSIVNALVLVVVVPILLVLSILMYLVLLLVIRPIDNWRVERHVRRNPGHLVYATYHGQECRAQGCNFAVGTNDHII